MQSEEQLIKFNVSLALIDHFRSFKFQSHEFLPGYLQQIKTYLLDFQQKNAQFYASFQDPLLFQHYVLGFHYYLASIANIEDLFKQIGVKYQLASLFKSQVNKTNILNVQIIIESIQKLKSSKIDESFQVKQPSIDDYLNTYDIYFVSDFEQKTRKDSKFEIKNSSNPYLILDSSLVELGLKARGKLDPYVVSYICLKFNQKHKIGLFSILFASQDMKKNEKKYLYSENYSHYLEEFLQEEKDFVFDQATYESYMQKFVNYLIEDKDSKIDIQDLMRNIEQDLNSAILLCDLQKMDYIEKLLIVLLGFDQVEIRDAASIYLNVLYDKTYWQLRGPFKPKVATVGESFKIEYLMESEADDDNIVLMLSGTGLCKDSAHNHISWHKPKLTEYKSSRIKYDGKYIIASMDFGQFTKCGFYDWKFAKLSVDGKMKGIYQIYSLDENNVLKESMDNLAQAALDIKTQLKPIHGRFIVHPQYMRKLQIHEIFIDFQDQNLTEEGSAKSQPRGTFLKVRNALQSYKESGINCLYLMGALERDNGVVINKQTNQRFVKRTDASPLAITCRETPNTMLGGPKEFTSLMDRAKQHDIKIVIDCVTRISSTRAHKKYQNLVPYIIDEQGKKTQCFGTDGRALNFEDTTMLNYRKMEVWDLLIQEVIDFVEKYKVNGIHLDNGNAWPQIMKMDKEELLRKDPDDTFAYTMKQIFEGEVVIQDENTVGFWSSNAAKKYPNPFLIKLCKKLWQKFEDFVIISEAWIGYGSENRDSIIARSGPVPRVYQVPIALSAVFGQELKKDGTMQKCDKKSMTQFKTWYEFSKKFLPQNSIVVSSTTSHAWPYPALLYKRGTWPAVDLIFFLPDIPMTFIGEQQGHCYREKTMNIFTRVLTKAIQGTTSQTTQSEQQSDIQMQQQMQMQQQQGPSLEQKEKQQQQQPINSFKHKKKSQETVNPYSKTLKVRPSSGLMLDAKSGLQLIPEILQEDESKKQDMELKSPTKGMRLQRIGDEDDLIFGAKRIISKKTSYGDITRISSGVSISELARQHIQQAEKQIQQELGPEVGYDLTQIKYHYEHRRKLRNSKRVLSEGEFVGLNAEHDFGLHTHVFAFARYTENEIAIIAINFNESPVHVYLNMRNLKYLFDDYETSDYILKVQNWIGDEEELQSYEYYTPAEFIEDRYYTYIQPFQSMMLGIQIIDNSKELEKLSIESSVKRLKLLLKKDQTVYANQVSRIFCKFLVQTTKLQEFINGFGFFFKFIIEEYSINLQKLIGLIKNIRDNQFLSAKLFAIINCIKQMRESNPDAFTIVPGIDVFDHLEYDNRLGEVVFVSPELGRWSTVGGLGVMVNELSQGLALLDEKVTMISPYYHYNKKGETDYLDNATEKFQHKMNLDIFVGGKQFTLGVFEGVVQGVKLVFFHNALIFPSPYPDGDAEYTLKQMCVFARGCLEYFCQIKVQPSIIVSNDWFTGIVPGYGRNKTFGEFFAKTKFFHIVHNLDPMYEGRLYPTPIQGTLGNIHELPNEWLVDPYWNQVVLNPSRCALMTTHQWGTVSKSYCEELLITSPLKSLLSMHPKPFFFPNGIPKAIRMKNLLNVCGNNHLESKRKIQQKYFGYQNIDDSFCLFGFVGRITQQKGVHLILESFEYLCQKYDYKLQVIVGGMASFSDPYGSYCATQINYLRSKYKHNFWGDPNAFFSDGTLINCGCDFGLMPSLFEPGGIVQHEFFIANTPVIATSTGGLKDTVLNFDPVKKKGSGFTFHEHRNIDFQRAVDKAMAVYADKEMYTALRKSTIESCIDVAEVSRAWNKEFHNVTGKLFLDKQAFEDQVQSLDKQWDPKLYKEVNPLIKKKGKLISADDERRHQFDKVLIAKSRANLHKILFTYSTNKIPRPKIVILSGSFDNWEGKHKMSYNFFNHYWSLELNLKPGNYFYKFCVDGEWLYKEDDPINNDLYGNINNYLVIN